MRKWCIKDRLTLDLLSNDPRSFLPPVKHTLALAKLPCPPRHGFPRDELQGPPAPSSLIRTWQTPQAILAFSNAVERTRLQRSACRQRLRPSPLLPTSIGRMVMRWIWTLRNRKFSKRLVTSLASASRLAMTFSSGSCLMWRELWITKWLSRALSLLVPSRLRRRIKPPL
jgi:hypothetical protein